MDAQLVATLKQRGLFPLEIDNDAQEEYRLEGIDPSTLETHYNPGTPRCIIDRYERIRTNVLALHEMDIIGESESPEYRAKEDAVRRDLFELTFPTHGDVLEIMAERGLLGRVGFYRDPWPPKTGNAGTYRDPWLANSFVVTGIIRMYRE
jgi:hypothetical protein